MDVTWWQDSQTWANSATVAVIIVAVLTFLIERRRIERAREEQAFETVTTHYMSFLELAMQNPRLTLAELDTNRLKALGPPSDPEPDWARKDAIMFEYFYQLIEKVFILYRASDLFTDRGFAQRRSWDRERMRQRLSDPDWRRRQMKESKDFRTRQWLGWDAWLEKYAESPVLAQWWESLDNHETYDTHFMTYMECRLGGSDSKESRVGG